MRNETDFGFLFMLLILTVAVLTGCAGNSEDSLESIKSADIVEHPVEQLIPHYNADHLPVTTNRSIDDVIAEMPEEVQSLAEYLGDPHRPDMYHLEVVVSNAWDFDAYSVDESRVVMLDSWHEYFIEYDLNSHETSVLADDGQGPEDVYGATEIKKADSDIYLIRQRHGVARFSCASQPCSFEEITTLDGFGVYSVAFTPDELHALGQTQHRDADGAPESDAEGAQFVLSKMTEK